MGRASRGKRDRRTQVPGDRPEAPAGATSRAAVGALLIVAAIAIVYSNTLHAPFHFDDTNNIVQNGALRDLRSQWPPTGNRWLGYLSFALNYRLGGLEPLGYHVANVLVHTCNALLVFALAALTLRAPALRRAEVGPVVRAHLPLVAAALFAVHPLQTQAVTYVVQRFASLATLFYLLSLVLYVRARLALDAERPSVPRAVGLYGLSLVAAVAAMKTKEISFTLPVVVAGYELLFFERKRLLLSAPFVAIAALIPLGLVQHGERLADALGNARVAAETQDISRWAYLLTQARVVVKYLQLFLVPIGQNVDHDVPLSRSLAEPSVLGAIALLLAIAAGAVFLHGRARRANRAPGTLLFFGVGWLFVTLSVESSVIPIRDVMFEHRMYLPSAGASIAAAAALLWAVERLGWSARPGLRAASVLLVIATPLGVVAHERNRVWNDEIALWSDAVAKSPRKARAHGNLGLAYLSREMTDDAVRELRRALELQPAYVDALSNLGSAYLKQGRAADALEALRRAVALAPAHRKAHASLGDAYKTEGQLDDAIREYQEAIRFAALGGFLGDEAEAHNNLGIAYGDKGLLREAEQEHREAIRLSPSLAEAHSNLGGILQKTNRTSEAIEEHRRALSLKHIPEVVFNLAIALDGDGRKEEAIVRYEEFLAEAGGKHPDVARKVRDRLVELRAPPSRKGVPDPPGR